MFLTYFTLLMPAFSLLPAPALLAVDLLRWQNAPLLLRLSRMTDTIPGFGGMLEPRYIFRARAFDQ